MPYRSARSTRDIADLENRPAGDGTRMLRAADGHRAPPRYPDGRDFDICDLDNMAHTSEIRHYREDFS